jgi:hypothetical protein
MSADNGTYILQTYGPEFRVVYTQAIDNIYGTFLEESGKYLPNPKTIVETFSSSKIFNNIEDAWDYAFDIDEEVGYSEYGASLITDFQEYAFSDLEEQNAKAID